jgi:hypothetical protein
MTGFNLGGVGSELFILDRITKPAGVVALAKMMEPGHVVDAVCQLSEEGQVLGPQVEGARRSLEIKALIGSQIALSVLALVATALGPSRGASQPEGMWGHMSWPDQGFPRLKSYRRGRGRGVP